MEDRTAKRLIKALDSNTEALEAHTKVLNKVLSLGKSKPTGMKLGTGPADPEAPPPEEQLGKFVDGWGQPPRGRSSAGPPMRPPR